MSYHLRAFCAARAELPDALEVVLGFQAESAGEGQAEIHYKQGRTPLLAELWDGMEAKEEIDEFLELLKEVPGSTAKQRVVDHLRRTSEVVALRLPADIDDDGYEAAGHYFAYLVERSGALIQADGEGFYDDEELILEVS